MNRPEVLREIVVYLPVEGNAEPPLALANEMAATIGAGRAEIGVDALTGGVEVRVYYDRRALDTIRQWLASRRVLADVAAR